MNKPFELAVCIGRFQPVHKGHTDIVEQALKLADVVMVLVGVSEAVTPHDPFSFSQRALMLRGAMPQQRHLHIRQLHDHPCDFTWSQSVRTEVMTMASSSEVVLVAGEMHPYREMFKDWAYHMVPKKWNITGSHVRQQMFTARQIVQAVPDSTRGFLMSYMKTGDYQTLKEIA